MIDTKERFFESLAKKSCFQNIRRIVKGQGVSDIVMAKSLSSFLTHCVIEMESNTQAYKDLSVPRLAELTSAYIKGDITKEEARTKFLALYFED